MNERWLVCILFRVLMYRIDRMIVVHSKWYNCDVKHDAYILVKLFNNFTIIIVSEMAFKYSFIILDDDSVFFSSKFDFVRKLLRDYGISAVRRCRKECTASDITCSKYRVNLTFSSRLNTR